MKKLIKYIFKEFYGPFLMGIIAFVIFVSVQLLYELSETIVRNHVGFSKLLMLMWYNIPYFISMGIPVGVLFAIFWIISRLSNDNEIIAIQTLGIPTKKIVIPFLLIALILCGMTFWLIDSVVPNANYKAKEAIAKYIYQRPNVDALIAENQFVDLGDNKYLFVKEIDRNNGILYDLHLYEVKRSSVELFHAARAEKTGNDWFMYEGRIFRTDRDGFLKLDVSFNKLEMNIGQDVEEFLRFSRGANEMSSTELKKQIETFTRLGVNTSGLIVTYQSKFANSFAPLVIALLGVSLSLFLNLKSKSWSVITTFILVVLYQGSGAWLSALGKERIIDPTISPWIPNIIFGITGLILFLFLDTNLSFKLTEPLKKFFSVGIIILFLSTPSSIFSGKVVIESENFYMREDVIIFDSILKIEYNDSIVLADSGEVHLNNERKVKEAFLKGNVIFQEKEYTIQADEMIINYEESTALFLNSFSVQENPDKKEVEVRIFSESTFTPLNDELIVSRNSKITTCKSRPTYYFVARKVTIYPNKFLIARDMLIEFFGVPVFYFPFYFQNLGKQENAPFIFTFNFGDNKISVDLKLNYFFENNTNLKFTQKMENNMKTGKTDLSTVFKYGMPIFNGDFYVFSELLNDTVKSIGFSYENFLKDSYFRLNQETYNLKNINNLVLNIPKWETDFGTLEKISSEIIWHNNAIQYLKFYDFKSEAFQKKFRRSNISLYDLRFFAEAGNKLKTSQPIKKSLSELWEVRKTDISAKGRYNLYSVFSSLTGTFEYNQKTEAGITSKNQVLSKNLFSYKQDFFTFYYKEFEVSIGGAFKSNFNHQKDFVETNSSYFGKTDFDYIISPYIELYYSNFEFGYSLDHKNVLENSLTKTNKDQFLYNDYIGYRFSILSNSIISKFRIKRSIEISNLDDYDFNFLDFKIINAINPFKKNFGTFNSIEFDAQTNINIFGLNNIIQSKSKFDVSDEDNIVLNLTEFVITSKYSNILDHRTKFEYNHQKEIPIEFIENREIITYNRNRIEINYKYYFGKDSIKEAFPEILTKHSLILGGNRITGKFDIKNELNLFELETKFIEAKSAYNYILKSSYDISKNELKGGFGYETRDKTENIKFDLFYDLENNIFKFSTFEITKRIVCWSFTFKTQVDLSPNFNMNSFSLSFFITYMNDKAVSYSDDKGFEFNLM